MAMDEGVGGGGGRGDAKRRGQAARDRGGEMEERGQARRGGRVNPTAWGRKTRHPPRGAGGHSTPRGRAAVRAAGSNSGGKAGKTVAPAAPGLQQQRETKATAGGVAAVGNGSGCARAPLKNVAQSTFCPPSAAQGSGALRTIAHLARAPRFHPPRPPPLLRLPPCRGPPGAPLGAASPPIAAGAGTTPPQRTPPTHVAVGWPGTLQGTPPRP